MRQDIKPFLCLVIVTSVWLSSSIALVNLMDSSQYVKEAGLLTSNRFVGEKPLDGNIPGGVVSMLEDSVESMQISDLFIPGWDKVAAEGNVNIAVNIDTVSITFTPLANWFGTENIVLIATYLNVIPEPPQIPDPMDAPGEEPLGPTTWTESAIVMVEVLPVNDPPTVAQLPGVQVNYGAYIPELYDLDESVNDIDSELEIQVYSDIGLVDVYLNDNIITLDANTDSEGEDSVTVWVCDGEFTVYMSFPVTVTSPYRVSGLEDTPCIQLLNSLFPGSLLSVEVISSGPYMAETTMTPLGEWLLTARGQPNWNGRGYITLCGECWWSDLPRPLDDTETPESPPSGIRNNYITLDTAFGPVNDPPSYIGLIQDVVYMTEDIPAYYVADLNGMFWDVDSELTFTCTVRDGDVVPTVDPVGRLSLAPLLDVFGSDELTITGFDGEYSASGIIGVEIEAVNDIPVQMFNRSLYRTMEDVAIQVDLAALFADVDSPLLFSLADTPNATAEFDQGNATAMVTPLQDWSGCEVLRFEASDGESVATSDAYMVVSPVNDPPIQTSVIPAITIDEDGSYTLDISTFFEDTDSKLAYSLTAIPTGIGALSGLHHMSVTPARDWNGIASVTVTASDGEYALSQVIIVIITPVDDPPIISQTIPELDFNEDGNAPLNIIQFVSDVDDPISLSVSTGAGLSLTDAGNGLYVVSATPDWNGISTIDVVASSGTVSRSFQIPVVVAPVNDAPRLVRRFESLNLAWNESGTVELSSAFVDPEGNPISIMADCEATLATGLASDGSVLFVRGAENCSGRTTVVVTASDGIASTRAEFDVIVAAAPVQASLPGGTIPLDTGYLLGGGLVLAAAVATVALAFLARTWTSQRVKAAHTKSAIF
jgi:hypothetical protein